MTGKGKHIQERDTYSDKVIRKKREGDRFENKGNEIPLANTSINQKLFCSKIFSISISLTLIFSLALFFLLFQIFL